MSGPETEIYRNRCHSDGELRELQSKCGRSKFIYTKASLSQKTGWCSFYRTKDVAKGPMVQCQRCGSEYHHPKCQRHPSRNYDITFFTEKGYHFFCTLHNCYGNQTTEWDESQRDYSQYSDLNEIMDDFRNITVNPSLNDAEKEDIEQQENIDAAEQKMNEAYDEANKQCDHRKYKDKHRSFEFKQLLRCEFICSLQPDWINYLDLWSQAINEYLKFLKHIQNLGAVFYTKTHLKQIDRILSQPSLQQKELFLEYERNYAKKELGAVLKKWNAAYPEHKGDFKQLESEFLEQKL